MGWRRSTVVPETWKASREDQAFDFFNIAVCSPQEPQPPPPPPKVRPTGAPIGRPVMLETKDAWPEKPPGMTDEVIAADPVVHRMGEWTKLAELGLYVGVTVVLVPCLVFCLMLPLIDTSLPVEFYHTYFWSLVCTFSFVQAECMARLGFGDRVPAKWLILMWSAVIAIIIAVGFAGTGRSRTILFLSVMISLLCPVAFRLGVHFFRHLPYEPLIAHELGMTFGALPTLVTTALYVILVKLGVLDDYVSVLIAVMGWNLLPFGVMPVGTFLFIHGSPANKFVAPYMWKFYCEMAFGTLGLLIFMRTPAAAMTYAASVVLVFSIHLYRGTSSALENANSLRRCWRKKPEKDHITRGSILLAAFTFALGRSVGYVLFLCFVGAQLAVDNEAEAATRSVLIKSTEQLAVDILIFRDMPRTEGDIGLGIAALVIVWASYWLFCGLLPSCWRSDPVARLVPSGTFAVAACAERDCKPSDDEEPAMTDDEGVSRGAAWDQARVLCHVFKVNRSGIVAMIAFQIVITVATVSMARGYVKL